MHRTRNPMSSSPTHPASLKDPASHSPELIQLVDMQISQSVIGVSLSLSFHRIHTDFICLEYLTTSVIETVNYALSPTVLSRAEVTSATVLVSLAYISRARRHLSIALEEWALERVFLGAVIVASKYTQDSTLRSVQWAMVTGIFGKGDIGRIEREFLDVLDWELSVTEADLLAHHEMLMLASSALAS
ncbi:cyclin N-terminal domain-containing protein [Favolaschia claudopus]|uniref:Cyclin N-terminal domain-containing protein n=1 Tax=Favolaschia claudopus TaxID=2862362 RepID=A0AAW0B4T9_9AGAR